MRDLRRCDRSGCKSVLPPPGRDANGKYAAPGHRKPGWIMVTFYDRRKKSRRVCSDACAMGVSIGYAAKFRSL